jgi:hypothetical protein
MVFTSMDVLLHGGATFKWEKRFTTISLHQFHHSIVLSQLPSRGTFPLSLSRYFCSPY